MPLAHWVLPLSAVVLATSCRLPGGSEAKGEPLARVENHYLYLSDLADEMKQRNPMQDSVVMLKSLVSNWIRQQVLLRKAEKNLDDAQKNKEQQLQDYRNALVIYEYEKQLIEQKLDTSVSEEAIRKYYNANKSNFELKKNLIRLRFVKIDPRIPVKDKMRELIKSTRSADIARLADLCKTRAVNYFIDDQVWLSFEDVLKEIPIKTYDEEQFLRNNNYVELSDNQYLYLVNIIGYRIKNSNSALEFEHDKIREIIINQRKLSLINKMEQNMLKEAELEGVYEIY